MFKDFFKKAQKKKQGPPEKQFFDSPDGPREKAESLKEAIKKRPVLFVVFILIVVFLSFSVFSPRSKKTKGEMKISPVEEGRIVMTAESMEKAIKKSSRSTKKVKRRSDEIRAERKKRKYDTKIAVFVSKPEEEKNMRLRETKEEFSFGLPSGTKVPALLSDRIFSFNVRAPVQAILPKDFSYGDEVVIPKGARFLGEADVVKSLDRINVSFDLLILPDGREVRVRALALSEDGAAGIQGDVDRHTDRKVLKAIGESVLSVGSLFLGGRGRDPYSLEDQLRLNVSQNLHDEARQNLREARVEKSITVESYTPIQVILLEAI